MFPSRPAGNGGSRVVSYETDTRRLVRPGSCSTAFTGVAKSARRANHFDFAESCQVLKSKIFCFTETKIRRITRPVPAHPRDASRSSRNVGLGMRWTLWRQVLAPDESAAAYGEVVWSWRRDPGVYPVRLCGPGNGDNKRPLTGESTKEAVKPLRGESRDVSAVPVVLPPCFLLHGDYGRSRRPAFPAPSAEERDNEIAESGRKPRRGNEGPCFFSRH
jgi:hypothetical protein